MTGKVVVVTGGNSGIGRETCSALASMGATVVLGARNATRGRAAVERIRARTGAGERVQLGVVDLASFASIRAFATEVLDRHDRLDVLVNNAGLVLERRLLTHEGFEMTFGVNHLGHFLLTDLLLDRLKASAPSRVVTVSSIGHRFVLTRYDRCDVQSEGGYWGFSAYAKSKLANILFTRELARRLDGTGVTATCLHPGFVRSGFGGDGDDSFIDAVYKTLGRVLFVSPARGARTSIYAASSPRAEGLTGAYLARCRRHHPSFRARDARAAAWLWHESERFIAEAGA